MRDRYIFKDETMRNIFLFCVVNDDRFWRVTILFSTLAKIYFQVESDFLKVARRCLLML